MANEILLGAIKTLGDSFSVQIGGRVLGLRIVGEFTGTIDFESRNGADSWASQSLKALDGSETSDSSTDATGDWRGLVPRGEFRCISSAWEGGIAYINAVVEEPIVASDPVKPILLTLADGITGAHTSDPFRLDYVCDTHVVGLKIIDGVVDLETFDGRLQGSIDGQKWVDIFIIDVSSTPPVDNMQTFKSGVHPPALGWVRLKIATLDAASGEDTPHVTFKYSGIAAP